MSRLLSRRGTSILGPKLGAVACAIVLLLSNGAAASRATLAVPGVTAQTAAPGDGSMTVSNDSGRPVATNSGWAVPTEDPTTAIAAGTPDAAACATDGASQAPCAIANHHGGDDQQSDPDEHGHHRRHRGGRGDHGGGHDDGHSHPVITLNPPSAINVLGTSHTVTATVTDDNGPLVGVFVDFEVSGANAGITGTCVPADCTTDNTGTVTGTYFGINPGDDTITATISCGGEVRVATATKTWTAAPPTSTTTTTTSTTTSTTSTTTTTTTMPPPPSTTTTEPTTEPTTTTTTAPTGLPPDIFQVELRSCIYLHVGYNRFPEGTLVRWNVTQSSATIATGQFTALGGGKEYHFLTMPLGDTLTAKPKGTAHFHWFANGVKSSYTAGRQPGC